jgi:hypothetical protein
MTITDSQETGHYLEQPEHLPSFIELGRKCMAEADSLKFTDSVQSQQLYEYASTYFQKAVMDISDPVVITACNTTCCYSHFYFRQKCP